MGAQSSPQASHQFLRDWQIHHYISSVAFPHSNCRAEIGVKSIKRLISNNVDNFGTLNTNKLQTAILAHRNQHA